MTTPWTTLVDVETLAAALDRDDLAILDCRFSLAAPEAGPAAYAASHIPGALYVHLDRDLSDHRKRGGGRHPWPDASDFNARLGDWGITAAHQVVAYDDGDGAHAARLWFLLRALGHERAAVLDGGWARWTALGLPTQTGVRDITRVARTGRFDDARLLDATQVQGHLARGGMLVDARARERFRGEVEPIDRVAGHVPGAVNRPYADNLAEGRFKPREQLAREFRELLGAREADDVVAMCGSGVTACHHLLAMEHAGLPGAKLFTGSWSGWIEDPQRPVASGP
ncbi:sulfurtransferase [Luteimonas sp. 22616]|uniref:sulfurtransferase n=1 Tax=Luteimonas sp. 22616 TaxID=3453951 RepID=UPI003F845F6A